MGEIDHTSFLIAIGGTIFFYIRMKPKWSWWTKPHEGTNLYPQPPAARHRNLRKNRRCSYMIRYTSLFDAVRMGCDWQVRPRSDAPFRKLVRGAMIESADSCLKRERTPTRQAPWSYLYTAHDHKEIGAIP